MRLIFCYSLHSKIQVFLTWLVLPSRESTSVQGFGGGRRPCERGHVDRFLLPSLPSPSRALAWPGCRGDSRNRLKWIERILGKITTVQTLAFFWGNEGALPDLP
jgi:hypothetical protein